MVINLIEAKNSLTKFFYHSVNYLSTAHTAWMITRLFVRERPQKSIDTFTNCKTHLSPCSPPPPWRQPQLPPVHVPKSHSETKMTRWSVASPRSWGNPNYYCAAAPSRSSPFSSSSDDDDDDDGAAVDANCRPRRSCHCRRCRCPGW